MRRRRTISPGLAQAFWPCCGLRLARKSGPEARLVADVLSSCGADVVIVEACGSNRGIEIADDDLAIVCRDRVRIESVTLYAPQVQHGVDVCSRALDSSGANCVKIEVFDQDGGVESEAVLRILEKLVEQRPSVSAMPLVKSDWDVLERVRSAGGVAVRILANSIGSLRGIECEARLAAACEAASLPVIVEGGLRGAVDVARAVALGADYVIVARALRQSRDPCAFSAEAQVAAAAVARERCTALSEEPFGSRSPRSPRP